MKTPEEWLKERFDTGYTILPVTQLYLKQTIEAIQADALSAPAKIKKEGWINIYKSASIPDGRLVDNVLCTAPEQAAELVSLNNNGTWPHVATVKVTWEE